MKISFDDFKKMMSFDTKGKSCIEILFIIENSDIYNSCWMGKMPDREKHKDIYWYGLTPDGTQAHDYQTLTDMLEAKVFHGKSLKEIYDKMDILEIDGCSPEFMLDYYIKC